MAFFCRQRLLLSILAAGLFLQSPDARSNGLLRCRQAFQRVLGPDRIVGQTGVTFYPGLLPKAFSGTDGVVELTLPDGRRVEYNRTDRGADQFVNQKLYSEDVVSRAALDGKKVLDLGCGGGSFVFWMRKHGIEAYGVDIYLSTKQVQSALFERAEAWNTGLESDHFDRIFITWSTVSYIDRQSGGSDIDSASKTLNEAARLLKPGGLLWISPLLGNAVRPAGTGVELFERQSGKTLITLEGFELTRNAAGTGSSILTMDHVGFFFAELRKR